jgi:hypothetical protein
MLKPKLLLFVFMLGLFIPLFNVSAGTILSSHKYAWSDNIGYINFENITVTDTSLTGYAWSANKGFINFNPSQGGVENDGTGNLSGSAWGEQLGWIDFSDVNIDDNGVFFGTATGAIVGNITFDCPIYCDVETDWRKTITPVVVSTNGGGGGGGGGVSQILLPNPIPIPTQVIQDDFRSAQAKLIDIQKDGTINIFDFNLMIINWEKLESGNVADMNKDGIVNILDFNTLMVYWSVSYQL